GAGFVGSHVVQRLVRDGYDVKVVDTLVPQVHGTVRHDFCLRTLSLSGQIFVTDHSGITFSMMLMRLSTWQPE
ncbi:MAG: NAD-dependent epimerase/dehydratase family protein, partial [Thermomicrobiales bacterium]